MGLLDSFAGGSDSEEEDDGDPIDHYEVKWMPWDEDGGFRELEEWKDLDEPIDKEAFQWNNPDPEPGRYRLFVVKESGMFDRPEKKHRWKWDVGESKGKSKSSGSSDSKQLEREMQKLRNEISQVAEAAQENNTDPEQMMDELRAQMLSKAVSDPAVMERYGEKIFDEFVLDGSSSRGEDGPDYEEFSDSPFKAMAYDMSQTMMDEPHKMRQLGENMGGGVGSFIDGLAAGATDIPADQGEAEEAEAGEPNDAGEESALSGLDAGPTTLDDLDAGSGDEADDLADELTDTMERHREAEQRAESAAAESDDAQATINETPAQADTAAAESAEETDPHDMKDVTESGMRASPEAADVIGGDDTRDLDPNRCQFVKSDGEQCGNPKEGDSDYCWVEDHGPQNANQNGDDQEPPADAADESEEDDAEPGDGGPDEGEVAEAL